MAQVFGSDASPGLGGQPHRHDEAMAEAALLAPSQPASFGPVEIGLAFAQEIAPERRACCSAARHVLEDLRQGIGGPKAGEFNLVAIERDLHALDELVRV